jgi:hypothetical protein
MKPVPLGRGRPRPRNSGTPVGDEAVPAPLTNSAWDLLLLQTAALCRDAATGTPSDFRKIDWHFFAAADIDWQMQEVADRELLRQYVQANDDANGGTPSAARETHALPTPGRPPSGNTSGSRPSQCPNPSGGLNLAD